MRRPILLPAACAIIATALLDACADEGTEATAVDASAGNDAAADTAAPDASTDAADVSPDTADIDEPGPQCTPLAAHLGEMPDAPWTADCLELSGVERYLCGETWFWVGLSLDFENRPMARDHLSAIIEAGAQPGHERDLGRMHALRGQLSLAMVLENGHGDLIATINPDFDRAFELDPSNGIIATWKDSMDIALTWRLGNHDEMPALMERTWANVELCRMGNILSISGTTIGLPLSTGIPQDTIAQLDGWTCSEADFCYGNTWRAPWTMPGLAYHFGEAYARVGDRERAESYLREALVAEGSDQWPYRAMAEDTLANLDEFVDEFVALGEDGDAFDRMYANQEFGCVFCHSAEPPAHLVRTTRIGIVDDPGPDPDPDPLPEPDGDGACSGEDDMAALAAHPDIGGASSGCAIDCIGGGAETCVEDCVSTELGVSDACAVCFADMVECTLQHCLSACVGGATEACSTCQRANCMADYIECSGIAPP